MKKNIIRFLIGMIPFAKLRRKTRSNYLQNVKAAEFRAKLTDVQMLIHKYII